MVVAVGYLLILGRRLIELGHPVGQFLLFSFERVDLREHRHAFIEDRAAAKRDAILRQITGANALHHVDGAVIEPLDAGEHFQQGRLARSVGADNADALLRRDQPVQIFK